MSDQSAMDEMAQNTSERPEDAAQRMAQELIKALALLDQVSVQRDHAHAELELTRAQLERVRAELERTRAIENIPRYII